MQRPLLRSLLSAALTACFALSALTWGSMATCAIAGAEHGAPGDHASHRHSHGPHGAPGNQACLVHLCCAHLAVQPSTPSVVGRLAVTSSDPGFTPGPAIGVSRPAHSLPFAHAPPALSA